jgi:hypothetical protein
LPQRDELLNASTPCNLGTAIGLLNDDIMAFEANSQYGECGLWNVRPTIRTESDTDSLCEGFDTLKNGGPSFIGEFDFLMGTMG